MQSWGVTCFLCPFALFLDLNSAAPILFASAHTGSTALMSRSMKSARHVFRRCIYMINQNQVYLCRSKPPPRPHILLLLPAANYTQCRRPAPLQIRMHRAFTIMTKQASRNAAQFLCLQYSRIGGGNTGKSIKWFP